MKEEIKKWIEKAKKDLDTAKYNFDGRKIDASMFYSQQTAEKSLKALHIKKYGEFPKIHDLFLLGKEVNLPEKLIEEVKELTLAYVYSRPEKCSFRTMDVLTCRKKRHFWGDQEPGHAPCFISTRFLTYPDIEEKGILNKSQLIFLKLQRRF